MSPPYLNSSPSSGRLLFITPLRLSALPADEQQCAICHEPYCDYDPNNNRPDQEWAVRVDLAAIDTSSTRLCGHVFGKHCLTQHTRSKGMWKDSCPVCRQVWFESTAESSVASEQRRPRLPRMGLSVLRDVNVNGGAGQLSVGRSPEFIEHVFNVFGVADGSREVRGTVDDVEKALKDFYCKEVATGQMKGSEQCLFGDE